jgi:hypothetical protein
LILRLYSHGFAMVAVLLLMEEDRETAKDFFCFECALTRYRRLEGPCFSE